MSFQGIREDCPFPANESKLVKEDCFVAAIGMAQIEKVILDFSLIDLKCFGAG